MAKKRAKLAKLTPEFDGNGTRLRVTTQDDCEVSVIRGGPNRAYIWIGRSDGTFITTIEGEKVLRALARAINSELTRRKAHAPRT